jgi:hypothetical protein
VTKAECGFFLCSETSHLAEWRETGVVCWGVGDQETWVPLHLAISRMVTQSQYHRRPGKQPLTSAW